MDNRRKTTPTRVKSRVSNFVFLAFFIGAASPALAAGDLNQQIDTLNALNTAIPGAIPNSASGLYALDGGKIPEDIFFFGGTIDGTYYSNLLSSSSNPVGSATTTPTLSGVWQHTDGGSTDPILKVSIGALSSDSAQLSDSFDKSIGNGGVSLETPGLQIAGFHPLFSYGLQYIDKAFFDQHLATFHDLSIALKQQWKLSDADSFRNNVIALSFSGAQRFSDVTSSQSHTAALSLAYSATVLSKLGLGVSVSGSNVWYDDGSNAGRNDQNVRFKAEIDYPDALSQNANYGMNNMFVFKLIAQYTKNFSNRSPFENDGWVVGPAVTWKFACD